MTGDDGDLDAVTSSISTSARSDAIDRLRRRPSSRLIGPALWGGCGRISLAQIAVITGLFSFGIIASASAGIAQIIFFIFAVLFALSLIFRGVGTPGRK